MDQFADFQRFKFGADDTERTVYRKGSGAPVIVMHEVPGISAKCSGSRERWWMLVSGVPSASFRRSWE